MGQVKAGKILKKNVGKSVKVAAGKVGTPAAAARAPAPSDDQVVPPVRVKWSMAELKKFREQLERLRECTEADLEFLSSGKPNSVQRDASSERLSDEDQGAYNFNYETTMHIASNTQGTLQEINAALTRIQMGVYGACEQCHELISKPRLEAQPFAELCIKCKSENEKGRPRFRPIEGAYLRGSEAEE